MKRNILSNFNFKKYDKIIFVSPHLDDAIFSAGALLYSLKGDKRVQILNVFTKGGAKPYTRSARNYVRDCGYQDIDKLYHARLQEDKSAFNLLKFKASYLGFTDCLWRLNSRSVRSSLLRLLSRLLPELIHTYPTYKLHAGKGIIANSDISLVGEIAQKIKQHIKNARNPLIFCPLSVGSHVDHVIVKKACQQLDLPTLFWLDFPYSVEKAVGKKYFSKDCFVMKDNLKEKIALSSIYKSQLKPIFHGKPIPELPEYFYQKDLL